MGIFGSEWTKKQKLDYYLTIIANGGYLDKKQQKEFENIPKNIFNLIKEINHIFHTLYREELLETKDVNNQKIYHTFNKIGEIIRQGIWEDCEYVFKKEIYDHGLNNTGSFFIKEEKWVKKDKLDRINKKLHKEKIKKIKEGKYNKDKLKKILENASYYAYDIIIDDLPNEQDISHYNELKELINKEEKKIK